MLIKEMCLSNKPHQPRGTFAKCSDSSISSLGTWTQLQHLALRDLIKLSLKTRNSTGLRTDDLLICPLSSTGVFSTGPFLIMATSLLT